MISDALFDAVTIIRDYQRESIFRDLCNSGKVGPEVERVIVAMDELRSWMDCDYPETLQTFLDGPARKFLPGIQPAPKGTVREALAELRELDKPHAKKEKSLNEESSVQGDD